jgi:TPR repeat protein
MMKLHKTINFSRLILVAGVGTVAVLTICSTAVFAQTALRDAVSPTGQPSKVIPQNELDTRQKQLAVAMTAYVQRTGSGNYGTKPLVDLMSQGNAYAALMLHRLETVSSFKLPTPISKSLLDQASVDIDQLSQAGNLAALSWLSNIYRDGLLGRVKNENKAFELIKQAADKNYPYAQFVTGFLYATGKVELPRSHGQFRDSGSRLYFALN